MSATPPPQQQGGDAPPENKEWHHSKCRKVISDTLNSNPQVKFLLTAMAKAGCPVDESFFQCRPCTKKVLGHYSPNHGIVVCQNMEVPGSVVQDTITHELIHAFDSCRANLDTNNCVHQACTEIRAAHLSGDCKFSRELARGNLHIVNQMQECVFRRAELSLLLNGRCKDNATQSVRKAWDVCFKDYEPWNKIPY